jgi:ADP-heptose:LPS heptosyltransferase
MKSIQPRTIATFASAQIGDTLMATSLYQALRLRYPSSRITLLSQISSHPVLVGLQSFDIVETYSAVSDLARFDLVVLPVFCGDAKVRSHFDKLPHLISLDRLHAQKRKSLRNSWNGFYSHLLFHKHQVELNEELAREFGFDGAMPPLYCPQGDVSKSAAHRGRIGLYINTPINEFQSLPNRTWPLAHWQQLVTLLGAQDVTLVGGPSDQPNLELLSKRTGSEFVVTPSLADFTALCRNLRAFITTDGGLMHVAATTGVPIVSLHGASSPILLHPWIYPRGKCVSILAPNTCSPCQRSFRLQLCEQGITQMVCMERVDAAVVKRGLDELETLAPGSCVILKGSDVMTKKAYLRSWRRKAFSTANYNLARLTLNLTVRDRALESPRPSA